MSEETSTIVAELEGILSRLQEGLETLMEAIEEAAPDEFERGHPGGDSAKRILERAVDDVNFYYGRMVAEAVSLPQPPYIEGADFPSLREATTSLQLAHRRLSNLLHDLRGEDLNRRARVEGTSEYTLRQVLETAAAHYRLRAEQIGNARVGSAKGGQDDPSNRR
jgi:exonuclease VII small subunit